MFITKSSWKVLTVCCLVSMMALSGVALMHMHVASSSAQASNIAATGARDDAQAQTIHLLATVNPQTAPHDPIRPMAKMPEASFYPGDEMDRLKAAAAHDRTAPTAATVAQPQVAAPNTPAPVSTFPGQSQRCGTPPDMGFAAGDGYIMQYVNCAVAVYDRFGHLQSGFPISTSGFFHLTTGHNLFDPRIVYDAANNHFIVEIDDVEGAPFTSNPQAAVFYLAVSATANPTGTWHIYGISLGENMGTSSAAYTEFPGLGLDTQAVYFAGNRFTYSNSAFVDEFLGSVNLAQLEAGAASISIFTFNHVAADDGPAFSIRPAVTYGMPRSEIMVSTDFNHTGYYLFWSLSNPISKPRLSYVRMSGPAFSMPPDANQPGGAGTVDTLDTRVTGQPVWRGGTLYFAFETAYNNGSGTNVAAIRWLEVNTELDQGNTVCGSIPNRCVDIIGTVVRDTSIVGYSGSYDAYFGSLAPDSDGNFVMTYTISSLNHRPYVAIYGRRVTLPPGWFGPTALAVPGGASLGYYAQYRWGDYSAVALDPTSCTAVGCYKLWFSGMFADAAGHWTTLIGSATYTLNDA